MENNVEIKCRKQDLDMVRSLIPEVEQEFRAKVLAECKQDIPCKITLNEENLERSKKNCIGGVLASTLFGRIECSNTVQDRIELVFAEFLPDIRSGLFPDYK